jgi:hypothetical protein
MPLSLDRLILRLQRTVGALPSLLVFLSALAVTFAGGLTAGAGAGEAIGAVAFVILILYCVLRPANGTDVFGICSAPGLLSLIPAELFDISRLWIALPVLPISLALLFEQDRRDRRARRGDPGGAVSSAVPPAP